MPQARSRCAIAVAVITGGVLACGCNRKAGMPRYPVTGTVTYSGKPLLAGRIAFEPDTQKGNKGPAAYGDISAGRYQTYDTAVVVGGPHRVVIEGYSGTTALQTRRMSPLFPPHITTVDLPLQKTAVNFDVPAAAPPGRKPEDKKRISAGR